MSAVLLADAKTFLNFPSTSSDAELQDMLDSAEAHLAKRIGPLQPVIVPDERHTGPGPLVLNRRPVISVTSATNNGVAVTDLDLDADAGKLYGTFSTGHRSVRVTYTAGRAALSPDLERAVLELTGHLWESQRPAGARTAPPGGFVDEDAGRGGGAFLLPYRVQSLIESDLLPPGFA